MGIERGAAEQLRRERAALGIHDADLVLLFGRPDEAVAITRPRQAPRS